MSSMMIRCPSTGRDVFTGIEIERVSFDQLPDVASHIRCPICAGVHVWTKSTAWLASDDTADPRAAPPAPQSGRWAGLIFD